MMLVQESMIFDILEMLARAVENGGNEAEAGDLRAGFSRYTDGVDLEHILDTIESWDISL